MTPVEEFLSYLKGRNRAAETIRTYRSILAEYVKVVGDPFAADVDDADIWWDHIGHLSAAASGRALSCVNSFYRWAMKFDRVEKSPMRRLDAPSLGRRLPRPVSRSDWLTILENTEGDLRRAVCLACYAGLRIGEVADLDWSDIDTEARRLYVRGKGDHDRVIGLGPILLDELLPNTGGNVVTAGGKPYSHNTLQVRINRHLRNLGIEGTAHKLRARYATQALAHTGNLLAVSRALGHSGPNVTARYAATTDSDLDLISAAVER